MAQHGTVARFGLCAVMALLALACSDGSGAESHAVPDGGLPDADTPDAASTCPGRGDLDFAACIGEEEDAGVIFPPGGWEVSARLTGLVEHVAPNGWSCRTGYADGRHFGSLDSQDDQRYAVRGEASVLYLQLRLPEPSVVLREGEVVQIDFWGRNEFWMPPSATIELRDVEGELIYWFGQTTRGAIELSIPDGFTASRNGDECAFEASCGPGVVWGMKIDGLGTGIELAAGEQGQLGDFTFYSFASQSVAVNPNGEGWACIDQLPYDQATVVMVRTDRLVAE